MKKLGISLFLFTALLVFSAASCSRTPNLPTTTVSELTIATGIDLNNRPENNLTTIGAGTEEIYLTGKIERPSRTTQLRVRWLKLPNAIVTSEDFSGRGTSSEKFDYDRTQTSDYFASRVQKEGVSWATGDYRAEVYVDNRKIGEVEFEIVPDAEAEAINIRSAISKVIFGSRLSDEDTVATPQTTFERTTDNIHIQVVPGRLASGAKVQVTVKHVKDQITLNTSNLVYAGEDNLLISLARSRFGRFWPDGLWAIGVYEVSISINSTQAATYTFTVR